MNYYQKYLKYKNKYLKLKLIHKGGNGRVLKYSIDAHGAYDPDRNRSLGKPHDFSIPTGVTLFTVERLGRVVSCPMRLRRNLCEGHQQLRYQHTSQNTPSFPNYELTSDLQLPADQRVGFFSGVRECRSRDIIFNIDTATQPVFLRDLLELILRDAIRRWTTVTSNDRIEVYLLFCLVGVSSRNFSVDTLTESLSELDMQEGDTDMHQAMRQNITRTSTMQQIPVSHTEESKVMRMDTTEDSDNDTAQTASSGATASVAQQTIPQTTIPPTAVLMDTREDP